MLKYTLNELTEKQADSLEELVNFAGSPSHLAKMLNKDFMVVKGWLHRRRISKQGAILVEKHPTLGKRFKAIDLRPDLNA